MNTKRTLEMERTNYRSTRTMKKKSVVMIPSLSEISLKVQKKSSIRFSRKIRRRMINPKL